MREKTYNVMKYWVAVLAGGATTVLVGIVDVLVVTGCEVFAVVVAGCLIVVKVAAVLGAHWSA